MTNMLAEIVIGSAGLGYWLMVIAVGLVAILLAAGGTLLNLAGSLLRTLNRLPVARDTREPGSDADQPLSLYRNGSDTPAPAGWLEYMQAVQEASPTADGNIRWPYAFAGLTRFQVAEAERDRLAAELQKLTPASPANPVAESQVSA